jgi:branched-chain amino acid transport system permease protein
MNLAHGEFYMWGAVAGYFVIQITGSFWVAVPVVFLLGATTGLVVERVLLRNQNHQVANTLILTFGLAMVMQHLAHMLFGGAPRRIAAPELLSGTFSLFGVGYSTYRVFVAMFAATILISAWAVVHRTSFGAAVRVVRENPELASSRYGIPVWLVYWVTFGVGSGVAALAGLLAAPIVAVDVHMGTEILPLAFMAVIVGGFGDMKGPVLAAIAIGLSEGLLTCVVSPIFARVATLGGVAILLLVWPQGIGDPLEHLLLNAKRSSLRSVGNRE